MIFPFFARKQRLRLLPVLLSGLLCGSFWMWMIMAPADVARHGLVPAAAAQVGTPGFSPQTYKSGVIYGNGVYFAPYAFTVYREPDSHAEPVGTFQWRHGDDGNHVTVTRPGGDRYSVSAGHPFLSFYPGMDIAMMAVVGENGQGWAEVVYDQSTRKTGWVQLAPEPARRAESAGATPSGAIDSAKPPTDTPAHFGVYQTWLEFMRLNAKTGGVYWLSGVREYNRSVRMSDADDAKMIPVTIIRDLKVKHVRGNWLLVEVLDFERNRPLGWVRWRDDEGNLMVFPNLSGRKLPIVTTAY